jgi:hypothetical protein
MKLPTESKMKTWYEELERVRKLNTVSPAETPTPDFAWINTDQTGSLPNPYKQYDDEDTDDEDMMSHAVVHPRLFDLFFLYSQRETRTGLAAPGSSEYSP